ncbi:MAG: murein biosynthesis integral membrane protein MurJ [bacterium]|nr:MAG: Integral membrane protein MviN [candidate division TA06 bacterium 32_111]KUK87540.1 MAG: Integral membrane protein MviN [candidate division TA06 bacterium 34_109]MDI6700306.1 murein biosynthesis integral membrane protein MurJ [bacterium]
MKKHLSLLSEKFKSNFFKSIFSTSILIGISRFSGFLREVVYSAYLGTSRIMDGFLVAFLIPNFFRRILGERAAESVFLPMYIREREKSEKDANDYMSILFTTVSIILIFGIIVLYLFSPFILKILAPGFDKETFNISLKITYIILPYMFFIGIYSFLGSLLESYKKFSLYNISPLLFNTVMVVAIPLFYKRSPILTISFSVLVGVIAQTAILFLGLKTLPIKYRFKISFKDERIIRTFHLLLPIIVASFIEKSAIYVDRIMGSILGIGAISALHFSFLLTDLPFAVFSIAISKVIHPYISEKEVYSSKNNFKNYINRGIILNLIILLPITLFFIIFAKSIIRIVYLRGEFNIQSLNMTYLPFIYYTLGLIPMGLIQIFSKGFYSLLNTKTPLYVSGFAMIINILLNIILVPKFNIAGIAFATSLSYWIHSVYLYFKLKKSMERL